MLLLVSLHALDVPFGPGAEFLGSNIQRIRGLDLALAQPTLQRYFGDADKLSDLWRG